MPTESIKTPKAPASWKPNPDQQRRIQSDPRLKRLSRDELYLVFNNQPKAKGTPTPTPTATSNRKRSTGGGLGSILNRVRRGMGGG